MHAGVRAALVALLSIPVISEGTNCKTLAEDLTQVVITAPESGAFTNDIVGFSVELTLTPPATQELFHQCCLGDRCLVCFKVTHGDTSFDPVCASVYNELPAYRIQGLPTGTNVAAAYFSLDTWVSRSSITTVVVVPRFNTLPDISSSWADSYREASFNQVYSNRIWGDGHTVSGPGSHPLLTQRVRDTVSSLIRSLPVSSLLDIGCGDLGWMSIVKDLPLVGEYMGVDIVEDLIVQNRARFVSNRTMAFQRFDIVKQIPEKAYDLVVAKDVFIHLPPLDVLNALENISKSGSKYLLTTSWVTGTGYKENVDPLHKLGGFRRVNLLEAPFNVRGVVSMFLDRDYMLTVDGSIQDSPKYLILIELPLKRDELAPEIK